MRLRHRVTGVVVNVRDDKPMSPEWAPCSVHSGPVPKSYDAWTVRDLKQEISRRNEGRDADRLSPYANKAGLIEALEADDRR